LRTENNHRRGKTGHSNWRLGNGERRDGAGGGNRKQKRQNIRIGSVCVDIKSGVAEKEHHLGERKDQSLFTTIRGEGGKVQAKEGKQGGHSLGGQGLGGGAVAERGRNGWRG